jgi:hypothetical protein
LQGPVTAPQLETASLVSAEVNFRPPGAPQPAIGGAPKAAIFAGNDRFSGNVVRMGDRIWAVQAIDHDGRAAARWFEVAATTGDVVQSGVVGSPELSFYYPSITVNNSGDVVIGFSGSSATQPVSSYAVVGQTTGGVTTFGEPLLLKAGVDDYQRLDSRGRNRWGDYSATVVDPNDSKTFWTFQQFVSGDDEWAIQITQILVGESTPRPGDANGDDVVDRADVAVLAAHFGIEQGATFADGNFNDDGVVNLLDARLLQANLNVAGPVNAVGEPSAALSALVVTLLGMMRRSRKSSRSAHPAEQP